MNTTPISRAIIIAAVAFAGAYCMGIFATLYESSQSFLDHVFAFLPFLGSVLMFGIVFQLTMNTGEMQANRSPTKPQSL